jgi:hypothetical protein
MSVENITNIRSAYYIWRVANGQQAASGGWRSETKHRALKYSWKIGPTVVHVGVAILILPFLSIQIDLLDHYVFQN